MDRVLYPGTTPARDRAPSVSVIVPALNEERNLPYVFGRIPSDVGEVILVDGGSIDRTVAVARELRPSVIVVPQTRTGKGNALACGFRVSTGDINVLFGTRFTDLCYGYNAFWRHTLTYFDLPDVDLAAPTDGEKLWATASRSRP